MTSNEYVHLQAYPTEVDWSRGVCGARTPLAWTDDPQAVTCPKCVAFMDLQPA